LLLIALVAVSVLEIERTLRAMVSSLDDSGALVINQTFEQIRSALDESTGDPAQTLRHSHALRTFLESAQAFGKGVVYSRIELPDGSLITGGPAEIPDGLGNNVKPLEDLRSRLDSWWPLTWLRPLLSDTTYELRKPVSIDGRPFAIIRVGLSTGLIS